MIYTFLGEHISNKVLRDLISRYETTSDADIGSTSCLLLIQKHVLVPHFF